MENQFTNGLFSLLDLSKVIDRDFSRRFFRELCNLELTGQLQFAVLPGAEPSEEKKQMRRGKITVDGEVHDDKTYIAFETKILSGGLRKDQIVHHLRTAISCRGEPTRRLVLLTPSDPTSEGATKYIADCGPECAALGLDPGKTITHLRWRDVFNYLAQHGKDLKDKLFDTLVDEYLNTIRCTIFDQDYVGIIYKVAFNDTTCLHCPEDIIEALTQPSGWGMPNRKAGLDSDEANPKRILIYVGSLKVIFCEAIVQGFREDSAGEPDFPFRYQVRPGSVRIFDPPIPLSRIKGIETLENLGRLRGYVRLRNDVYQKLVEGQNNVPAPVT
jgi:hypothetical protein